MVFIIKIKLIVNVLILPFGEYINANIKLIYGINDNILIKKCQYEQSVNVEFFLKIERGKI